MWKPVTAVHGIAASAVSRSRNVELRVARREHHVRVTARGHRVAHDRGGVGRGRVGQRAGIGEDPERGTACGRRVTRTAGARCASRRGARRSSGRARRSPCGPASGSASIAASTSSRRPLTAACTVSSCATTTRRSCSASTGGATARSRPRMPSASTVHMLSTTTSAGQVGTLAGVRDVERQRARVTGDERVDRRGHQLARRQPGDLGLGEHRVQRLLVLTLVPLALLDRREVHAPAPAPVRLLGEEAGEELGEVTVAGGGERAEPAEQLELEPVAGDEIAARPVRSGARLAEPDALGQIHRQAARARAPGRRAARAAARSRRGRRCGTR